MKRRKAREYTVQLIYMLDTAGDDASVEPNALMELHRRYYQTPSAEDTGTVDEPFWRKLVQTTLDKLGEIDALITAQSDHWKLDRMTRVDRSILRMGVAELFAFTDIAPSITINEAVEIAKRFGSEDSAPFVNGVLDNVWKKLEPTNPKPSA
jgi:N utilization substance protein B